MRFPIRSLLSSSLRYFKICKLSIFIGFIIFGSLGCLCTTSVIEKAEGNSAYYLLVPVAIPTDIIISPFVIGWTVYAIGSGNQSGLH